jgi:putative transposase
VGVMCRLLDVQRSCFYHFEHRQRTKPEDPMHDEMLEWVVRIALASGHTYGSRRMQRALNCLGYPVNRPKARQLMQGKGVGTPPQAI